MLKKEGNGWTRGAEDVMEDGGRRMCEEGNVSWCGGAVRVELAGQMVRN